MHANLLVGHVSPHGDVEFCSRWVCTVGMHGEMTTLQSLHDKDNQPADDFGR